MLLQEYYLFLILCETLLGLFTFLLILMKSVNQMRPYLVLDFFIQG